MAAARAARGIAVIGAGPVGLAAAAHLLERGLEPLLLEAGPDVAASVRDWGHVRLFSPWQYNVDRAAERLLEANGWTAPARQALPSGAELYQRYLRPLSSIVEFRLRNLTSRGAGCADESLRPPRRRSV
jgi:2-polyprenyl-6-methoxyphenol hydroxylase-like FAD-dependent oxidoreductase